MTQNQRILDMHSDNLWHCQVEYWDMKFRSPHKRRQEIEDHDTLATKPEYIYRFEERPCVHGNQKSYDYFLHITSKDPLPAPQKPLEPERPQRTVATLMQPHLFPVERKPDYTKI